MARILNICDLAMAQNGLRGALQAMANASIESEPTAAVQVTEALADLYCAIMDANPTMNIDEAADAFEEVGYSRDLGAIAHRVVYAMGLIPPPSALNMGMLRVQAMNDIRATPEWHRLNRLYAEPVTPCCDWEVPASN